MKNTLLIRGAGVAEASGLDYRETAGMVQGVFSWKPGILSSLVVSALSRFTRPLVHGSYRGRPLSGEPHKASWVIASPLTVFVLPEKGRRHRLILAARLRTTGPINMIHLAPVGGRSTAFARGAREIRSGKRSKAPGSAIRKVAQRSVTTWRPQATWSVTGPMTSCNGGYPTPSTSTSFRVPRSGTSPTPGLRGTRVSNGSCPWVI